MGRSSFITLNNESGSEDWFHLKAKVGKMYLIKSITSLIRFPALALSHSYSPGDWTEIFTNATKYKGHHYVWDRRNEDEVATDDFIFVNAMEKAVSVSGIDVTNELSMIVMAGKVEKKTVYYDFFRTKHITVLSRLNKNISVGAVIDAASEPTSCLIIEYELVDATEKELIFDWVDNSTK